MVEPPECSAWTLGDPLLWVPSSHPAPAIYILFRVFLSYCLCSLLLSLVQMVLYFVFSLGSNRYAAFLPGHGFYIASKLVVWTLHAFKKLSLGLFWENPSSVDSIQYVHGDSHGQLRAACISSHGDCCLSSFTVVA